MLFFCLIYRPQLEPEPSEASISEYDSPHMAASHYRNLHHQQQQMLYDESSQNIDDGSVSAILCYFIDDLLLHRYC